MAKSQQLLAKMPARGHSSVIGFTKGELINTNTLDRLRSSPKPTVCPTRIVKDEHSSWGGDQWTGDDLRVILVQMVSEGMSLRNALESLRESHPPMPTCLTVYQWFSTYPEFKKSYQTAQKLRGEMLAEAANELVIQALDDPMLDPRTVKNAIEQFRWSASKLDREIYGDHRTVEVQQPMAGISDKDLDLRIKALMADPHVRGVLNAQGFEVLDVEVVEESIPNSEPVVEG